MLGFSKISVFLAIVAVSQAAIIQKEHSLIPPYEAGAPHLVTWDLTGSAEYGGTHIRLTPDEGNKRGAIWNNYPCFNNNWEIQLHFRIHGKGVHLNGDGMAIWYLHEADMHHDGPVFGSKDYFNGLGVFIDTFANNEEPSQHKHPFISAMANNGSIHYEHTEDGTMTQIGGCYAPVRNFDHPTRIAVSYMNEDLTVYVDNDEVGQWKICFKAVGVHLPTGYHFGISASTSDVTDNHDIIAATGLNMDVEDAVWEDRGDVIPKVENFEVPQKYHKDNNEKVLKKPDTKREMKEEKVDVKKEKVDVKEVKMGVKNEKVDVKKENTDIKKDKVDDKKGKMDDKKEKVDVKKVKVDDKEKSGDKKAKVDIKKEKSDDKKGKVDIIKEKVGDKETSGDKKAKVDIKKEKSDDKKGKVDIIKEKVDSKKEKAEIKQEL